MRRESNKEKSNLRIKKNYPQDSRFGLRLFGKKIDELTFSCGLEPNRMVYRNRLDMFEGCLFRILAGNPALVADSSWIFSVTPGNC
jgi:hypothetical protein